MARWEQVTTENSPELGEWEGYQSSFLRLFGFGMDGADHDADTNTAMKAPSLA